MNDMSEITRHSQQSLILPGCSRRRFIRGLAAGGAFVGLSPWVDAARAVGAAETATGMAPVLSGTEFDLTVAETAVNFTGSPRMATTVNGSIPAPILRWREGDTVTLRVTNRLAVHTSIHWHGILLPFQMDGVPGADATLGVTPAIPVHFHPRLQFVRGYGRCSPTVRDAARARPLHRRRMGAQVR